MTCAASRPPARSIWALAQTAISRRYRLGDNGALFSPQGGLRISMRDLAKLGQMLARGGKGFLSARSFAEMTRPQWRFNGRNGVGEMARPAGSSAPMALRCNNSAASNRAARTMCLAMAMCGSAMPATPMAEGRTVD
jgi:CubicO group peptidase (beta-lactamase class C family)